MSTPAPKRDPAPPGFPPQPTLARPGSERAARPPARLAPVAPLSRIGDRTRWPVVEGGGAGGPAELNGTKRSPLSLRDSALCFVVSVLAAIAAYGIGHRLPAVYQASGTIRVATATQSGIADSNVTAENDLASQYAQLVSSGPVVAMTAKALGAPPQALSGTISGSTVGAQNVLEVAATAGTPTGAVQRARAAVSAVALYLTQLTAQFNTAYMISLESRIRNTPILGSKTPSLSAPAVVAAFANSRATALFQALRDATGNQPAFQIVNDGGSASQTAPKPKLYALVAFLVVLLLSLRVAFIARSPVVR